MSGVNMPLVKLKNNLLREIVVYLDYEQLIQLPHSRNKKLVAVLIKERLSRNCLPKDVIQEHTLEGHLHVISSVIQLNDGRLASGSYDHTIRIWDNDYSGNHKTLNGHTHWVHSVIQLNDGRLVSGSDDKMIRIWDNDYSSKHLTLNRHTHWVHSVIQLNDGRLASGSDDKTIRIW